MFVKEASIWLGLLVAVVVIALLVILVSDWLSGGYLQ